VKSAVEAGELDSQTGLANGSLRAGFRNKAVQLLRGQLIQAAFHLRI